MRPLNEQMSPYEGWTCPATVAGWLADLWKGVSLKMNQQFPAQRMRLRKPKICRGVKCGFFNKLQAVDHTSWSFKKKKQKQKLTTETVSRPMWGPAPDVHLFTALLQALKLEMTLEGLVAHFVSVKPFPQAEDETNHMKVKTPVTNRSLKKRTRERKNPKKNSESS